MREGVKVRDLGRLMKYLIVLALIAAVALEGYYIMKLRGEISRQTEEMRNISVQLQFLKSERKSLDEEISSLKEPTGEKGDGNTAER
jgi:hypothetical protein